MIESPTRIPARPGYNMVDPTADLTSPPSSTHVPLPTGERPVMWVPPEILLVVFGLLADDKCTYEGWRHFAPHPPSIVDDDYAITIKMEHTTKHHWSSLRNLISVSRGWYAVGIGLLYSMPELRSPIQINLFVRTIKQNPDLARCLRGFHVRDVQWASPSFFDIRNRSLSYDSVRSNLFYLMRACPPGSHFSFENLGRGGLGEAAVGRELLKSTNVRELTLSNLDLSNEPTYLALPNLEILTVQVFDWKLDQERPTRYQEMFRFPVLQRVHTLRLVQMDTRYLLLHDAIPHTPLINHVSFPSLKNLQLYHNLHRIVIMDDEVAANLVELHVAGHIDMFLLRGVARRGLFRKVERLVMGFRYRDSDPYLWDFTGCLNTVTMFVPIPDLDEHGISGIISHLEAMDMHLEKQEDMITLGESNMRTINVKFISWDGRDDDQMRILQRNDAVSERCGEVQAAYHNAGIELNYSILACSHWSELCSKS